MHAGKFIKNLLVFCGLFLSTSVLANDVEIVKVVLTKYAGTWRADVTLRHADEGWKHYADGWRLVDSNGNEIGMRKLYHPHVNEQPFTRSLSSFQIPTNTKTLFVEAHDSKHGWTANKVRIDMSKKSGSKYTIKYR